ncbi:MAG: hypothetical protein KH186_00205 [Lachnospiraceae bacterium]|nr:hypothetical protein [Lachnospiraceae bacterium]
MKRWLSNTDGVIPPKWVKYKILTDWRLRDSEELESSIHRYHIRKYKECLWQIENELNISKYRAVYVIKLVCRDSVYKMPNFLVSNLEELESCRNKLNNINLESFVEIWYCKNIQMKEVIYGRVLFSLDEMFPRIITRNIEIVWGKSARMIEKYPDLECTFVTVETDGWDRHFRFIDLIQADKTKTEIQETIVLLLDLLGDYQDRIIEFGKFIQECDCFSLCIEFCLKNERDFTIIDWDSDNDMKVIGKMLETSILK